jgi:phage-related baseplate assembly protein
MVMETSLPEPDFIERDPRAITAEIIAEFERLTGRVLYPAQMERLLVNIIAYRETLVRVAIQEAAKQNLVRFAEAPVLDYLGEYMGEARLPAQSARTTLCFMLDEPRVMPLLIPAGTRVEVSGSGGDAVFETDINAVMQAGLLEAHVSATCSTPGTGGNGWNIGQINTLVDTFSDADVSVANTTVPEGGADEESSDRLRERIMLAPEKFSVAGSRLAYVAHVKAVHQSIIDVDVQSPAPCQVVLYPLLDTGRPGADMLALVGAALSGERVRPLTDQVTVVSPEIVEYEIEAELILYRDVDADSVLAAAQAAAISYTAERAAGLGRDIVPVQLESALKVPGVYDIIRISPVKIVVESNQWASCTDIRLSIAGFADG